MKYLVVLLCLLSVPALADDYSSGYDKGYYLGAYPSSDATNYDRGVNDGMADADDDDEAARQRSVDFERQMQSLSTQEPDPYGLNARAENTTDDGDQ